MSRHPDFTQFLSTPEPPELGPGPRTGVKSQAELEAQLLPMLADSTLSNERRQLVRALLLLWHDHLDASHGIAQNIGNADGAFVHGIMHRREPDFSNAAYWFRRVGRHDAFDDIASQVTTMLKASDDPALGTRLVQNQSWDPFAFIEACEEATAKGASQVRLLREVQRIETSALLHCFVA
jgi:hypothetical protein